MGYGLVDARSFIAGLGAEPAGTAAWPAHQVLTGSVGANASRDTAISVSTAGRPLGVTLQITTGARDVPAADRHDCLFGYEWSPDLDAYLINPSGSVVAVSRCMLEATNGNCAAPGRFETLGVSNADAGTWTLRVESFSGAGSYLADVFGGLSGSSPAAATARRALGAHRADGRGRVVDADPAGLDRHLQPRERIPRREVHGWGTARHSRSWPHSQRTARPTRTRG